jgi:hypothetical protein
MGNVAHPQNILTNHNISFQGRIVPPTAIRPHGNRMNALPSPSKHGFCYTRPHPADPPKEERDVRHHAYKRRLKPLSTRTSWKTSFLAHA